jgi:hypothetical protein
MWLISIGLLAGTPLRADSLPALSARLGRLTLIPSGFLDVIGMTRSATTKDSISTRFGAIPLGDTPGESVASIAHSRLELRGELPVGSIHFGGWAESDFSNPNPDSAPFRWRQYFGSARYGKWELLGGLGWSLLRANRVGIESDRLLMNTDVIEPAYQVGLAGARRRQVRVAREFGKQHAAFAWESTGNWVGKLTTDRKAGHFEVAGFSGRGGRSGANAAAIVHARPRLRLIGQQFWSRRDLAEALGLVPGGVGGWATMVGVESPVARDWEIYSYAGEARGAHSTGNRAVRQYSGGFHYRRRTPSLLGSVTLSLQYSYLDRSLWDGRTGAMHYVMYRLRYTLR